MAMGCLGAFAQTSYSYVSSQWPIGTLTIGGNKFSVTLGVTYPANLSSSSYVPGATLVSEITGLAASYPSPTDTPEAILSSMLNTELGNHSQIAGGTLSASVAPTVSPTGQVTLGPTIEVVIGDFSVLGGIPSRPPSPQTTKIVRPLVRPVPVDPKPGN